MRRLLPVIAALTIIAPLRPAGVDVAPVLSATQATLMDLKSVDELKTLFNRDAGKVRLVLLVSPT